MVWQILGAVAVVLLMFYFRRGMNSVWGGVTIGAVVGLIIAIVAAVFGHGFQWLTIGKAAAVGTLVGFLADLPRLLTRRGR